MDLIAYYRKRPGRRKPYGLDVELQRRNVERFAADNGAAVRAEYTELEGDSITERPKLDDALADCRRQRACLIIGTGYRLRKNVEFLKRLRDSLFVVADDPEISTATLAHHISKTIDWAREHGNTIRKALPRNIKYGWARPDHGGDPAVREAARKKATNVSVQKRLERMRRAYGPLLPRIRQMREHDEPYHKIATVLNEMGCVTIAGMPFTATAICRIMTEYDLDD